MKKGLARTATAALVLGLSAALAACSGGGGGAAGGGGDVKAGAYNGPKVTILFWNGWTGGNQTKLVTDLVNQFNSSQKKITVKNVTSEWAQIASKMPLAIKAGKGPDVTVVHGDDLATYAAQGLLLKSDAITKSLGYKESDFPQGLFKAVTYNGAQYGVPWSVTPLGLYTNLDVLKKAGITSPPTDKAGYESALSKLKAKNVKGEWVDGFVFTGTFEFESLLWQNGGQLYNDDVSKATFNSPAGVKALTWMRSLIDKGYSPSKVAQDANINAVVAGKTAFNWNGIWQTSNEGLKNVKWTASEVPQIGDQKAVWSSSTHWAFVNNKGQDKNKTQAAAAFVKWMNDHSLAWAAGGELPAANKVRNGATLASKYPQYKPFLKELEYAHFETAAPGITAAGATITTAVNEAVLGKKPVKQALDDAVAKANQLLQQSKQQYGG
jgi:multiple sugar transport system substrate-binding protein